MSFRLKLLLLLVLVAVIPVALAGLLSAHANQKEMTSRIEATQRHGASLVARAIDDFVQEVVRALELTTRFIPFAEFPEADRADALRIPYRQFDYVNVVALLDGSGQQLTEPTFEPDPARSPELAAHESVTAEEVGRFGSMIPLSASLAKGAAFGPAYFAERTGTPRIALAIPFAVGPEKKERWVLAVEVSLREVLERVKEARPADGGTAFVVDGQGKVVCHHDRAAMGERRDLTGLDIVAEGIEARTAFVLQFAGTEGEDLAGAFAPIPTLGWGLVLAQPLEVAFAPARRLRLNTLVAALLALLVAMAGGVLFARGVSGPIKMLAEGAAEVGSGRFDRRIQVRGRDEIAQLAATFNQMALDLQASFTTIQEQNEEIRVWNEELQQRVDERTRELREAQQQIVQSQKLAAVAELGAGVAHEINNPLTGVLGFLELLKMKLSQDEKGLKMITTALVETRRIKTIVEDLRKFSVDSQGVESQQLEVNKVVETSLRMVQGQLEENRVEIVENLGQDLPMVVGNPADLQQALVHILSNARNAMPDGGVLTVETTEGEGGVVRISLTDTGRGIPEENLNKIFDPFFTTKDEWTGKGLGLSVALRIVQDHQGQIRVDSQVGRGSTFRVLLPGKPRHTQLV